MPDCRLRALNTPIPRLFAFDQLRGAVSSTYVFVPFLFLAGSDFNGARH